MLFPIKASICRGFPSFCPIFDRPQEKARILYVRAAATFLRGTRSKAIILVVVRHGAFPVALGLTLQKGMYTHEQSYTVHVGKSIPESWLISCTFWAGVFHNRTNQVLSH